MTTLVPGQDGVHWHQGGYGPGVLRASLEDVVFWKTVEATHWTSGSCHKPRIRLLGSSLMRSLLAGSNTA